MMGGQAAGGGVGGATDMWARLQGRGGWGY